LRRNTHGNEYGDAGAVEKGRRQFEVLVEAFCLPTPFAVPLRIRGLDPRAVSALRHHRLQPGRSCIEIGGAGCEEPDTSDTRKNISLHLGSVGTATLSNVRAAV
jgi:hypothetical protein